MICPAISHGNADLLSICGMSVCLRKSSSTLFPNPVLSVFNTIVVSFQQPKLANRPRNSVRFGQQADFS